MLSEKKYKNKIPIIFKKINLITLLFQYLKTHKNAFLRFYSTFIPESTKFLIFGLVAFRSVTIA